MKRLFLAALLGLTCLFPFGCASADRDVSNDPDDPRAAMRQARAQTISQMRAAGASASQIREIERQFDVMEKQMRQMQKQAEKMERELE